MGKALKIWRIVFLISFLSLTLSCQSGRSGRLPAPFETPMESRLILQVPFYPDHSESGAAAALAAVMTYSGLPTTTEKVLAALDGRPPAPHQLVVLARHEGLSAEYGQSQPGALVQAVKNNHPVIVRLQEATPPIKENGYAVVVGYTPEGPVLNSGLVNQQIIPWSDFLAGWHSSGNLAITIQPL